MGNIILNAILCCIEVRRVCGLLCPCIITVSPQAILLGLEAGSFRSDPNNPDLQVLNGCIGLSLDSALVTIRHSRRELVNLDYLGQT